MDILIKRGVNKYLIFDSLDENKDLLKKFNDVWNKNRDKIKEISGGECDYEKDYMKIKKKSKKLLIIIKAYALLYFALYLLIWLMGVFICINICVKQMVF